MHIFLLNFFRGMEKNLEQPNLPLVQNVVSFAKMNIENDLDLKLIAEKVEGSRYNKKRFPAVIMRKTKPKSTILVFKSGRMIIIGSESESDAEQAAKRSIKDIQKSLSTKLKMVDFHVTNIVANADLGCKIDIGKLCEERNVVRNENFPGVVYKQMEHVKSALIFASGKVVFTGAKTKDSIDNAFTELKKKMEKFRKSWWMCFYIIPFSSASFIPYSTSNF